jgi:hypothetical protein
MRLSANWRRSIAAGCNALGTVWTAAGVLKLVFGVRITFVLFPPIDLGRVNVASSLIIGLVLIVAGAWFRRSALSLDHAEEPSSGARVRSPVA